MTRNGHFHTNYFAHAQQAWLLRLESISWNVYIEGPPRATSRPEHVLKYLARYMSGGPISNSRLIGSDERAVTFWARSRDRRNQSRPFTLRGHELVRRWAMHILPKGFTKTRHYGGYHNTKRADYLKRCRELLPPLDEAATSEATSHWITLATARRPTALSVAPR